MKEAVFLKNNQQRWKELEQLLASKDRKNPDKLSDLFVQMTDDLSYSRTFFPDSKTTQYLNFIASQLHQEIYKNKKEKSNRFVRFWAFEVPMAVGNNIRLLFLSFLVLVFGFLIGWVTQNNDPDFVRFTLSDTYVNMTETNIQEGKPMDVYASMNEVSMFFMIMFNNIKVSFVYFMLGFFLGIGTIWRIFAEAIRIGSFLSFFNQQNVLGDSMLALWMHGTIEISVIVIAGQAGLMIGKGMLFPQSYSRLHSLQTSAMDALKIVIGLVPFFIFAALIESFLTRLYDQNIIFTLSVILLSLGLIISYFVVYPLLLRKKYQDHKKLYQGARELINIKKSNHLFYGWILTMSGAILIAFFLITAYSGGLLLIPASGFVYGLIRLYLGYQTRKTEPSIAYT